MNATLRGVVPALAIGLAACGSSKSAQVPPPAPIAAPECPGPAWTCFQSGPCPFPEFKDSLCAVGTADQITSYSLGMEAAKTRARREMAAVVQSQVDGFTRATQDSLSKSGAGEDSIQKVQDLAQNVVQRSLNGVAVPKTWYNTQSKVYFAIAVLDAQSFVNALKGLKEAKGLADSVKLEIDQRAQAVTDEWKSEVARKNGEQPSAAADAKQ
jgi:LPP20 lipoprotein